MTNLWIRSWKYFWDWSWGADKKCLSLSYHLLLHTQLLLSTERGASESVIPVLDHGQKGCRNQSQPPPLHHCACVWSELEILGLSFSVSYLSMKGFRMVIPNKKNIRTEKPIIVNPSSMARSSPALDGSLLCSSGGSPPLWSVFLFLPEVEMAVLWRKWGRDSSKEVGTFTNPWGVEGWSHLLLPKGCEQVPCNTMRSHVQNFVKSLSKHAKMVCYKFFSWVQQTKLRNATW